MHTQFPFVLVAAVARRCRPLLFGALLFGSSCGREPAQSPAQLEPTRFTRLEGDVQLPNGSEFAYSAILVADPARPGSYLGSIDIPRQTLWGATLQRLHFLPGQHVEFELEASGAPHWLGHYNEDGSVECRFSQSDRTLPCSMREVTTRAARAPLAGVAAPLIRSSTEGLATRAL